VTLDGKVHCLRKGGVAYIPRLTNHSVKNTGASDLVYIVVETYPEGYLPNEPTWDSHIAVLEKHYGVSRDGTKP
jgi:oxalate decarboxylase/phosphoglucose isomerase-like protein (cupin superfamily)